MRIDGNDEVGLKASRTRSWQPELHFAWDALIDQYFDHSELGPNIGPRKTNIHEFFRVTVDGELISFSHMLVLATRSEIVLDSLFSSNSTAERRFWGFEVFRKLLARADATDLPQLFTQNFARTWMNNLSGKDKLLNKIAQEVVGPTGSLIWVPLDNPLFPNFCV